MKFSGTQWTVEDAHGRITLTLGQVLGGMECTTRIAFAQGDRGAQMLLELVGELQTRFQQPAKPRRGRPPKKHPEGQPAPLPARNGTGTH